MRRLIDLVYFDVIEKADLRDEEYIGFEFFKNFDYIDNTVNGIIWELFG